MIYCGVGKLLGNTGLGVGEFNLVGFIIKFCFLSGLSVMIK